MGFLYSRSMYWGSGRALDSLFKGLSLIGLIERIDPGSVGGYDVDINTYEILAT